MLDVPLIDAGGDGVEAPVDEDAELGGVKPRGRPVLVADRGPGGFEWAVEIGPGFGVGVGGTGWGAELGVERAGEDGRGGGEERALGEEAATG